MSHPSRSTACYLIFSCSTIRSCISVRPLLFFFHTKSFFCCYSDFSDSLTECIFSWSCSLAKSFVSISPNHLGSLFACLSPFPYAFPPQKPFFRSPILPLTSPNFSCTPAACLLPARSPCHGTSISIHSSHLDSSLA